MLGIIIKHILYVLTSLLFWKYIRIICKKTISGPGGCDDKSESNIVGTGRTISAVTIAPGAVCEADVMVMPDGAEATTYTRLEVGCGGSESAEFVIYGCVDDACSACDDMPEGGKKNSTSKKLSHLFNLVGPC